MGKLESEIQQLVQIEARKYNVTLWRNNSGALSDATGRTVRYGLGNISEEFNRIFKSSDLIGLTSQGQFVAIECKREGWKFKGDKREKAQQNFIETVIRNGGVAGFVQSVDDFLRLIIK